MPVAALGRHNVFSAEPDFSKMPERRLSDVELAFELKKSGRTVAEIADVIGVSSRTIFNWFASKKPVQPVTTPPVDFDEAIEMLGEAAGIEVAVALDVAKSGRGATERIWRLARSLAIIRALAEVPRTELDSPALDELRERIARRAKAIHDEIHQWGGPEKAKSMRKDAETKRSSENQDQEPRL